MVSKGENDCALNSLLSSWIFTCHPMKFCFVPLKPSSSGSPMNILFLIYQKISSPELRWLLVTPDIVNQPRFCFFFFFLSTLWGCWDLISPTRDWTWATAVKVANPNHGTIRELPLPPFFHEAIALCSPPGFSIVFAGSEAYSPISLHWVSCLSSVYCPADLTS